MLDDLTNYIRDHERALRNWDPSSVCPPFGRPQSVKRTRSDFEPARLDLAVNLYEQLLEKRIEFLCVSIHGEEYNYEIDRAHALTLFHFFCERFPSAIPTHRPEKFRDKLLYMNVSRVSWNYRDVLSQYGKEEMIDMSNMGFMLKLAVSHHSCAVENYKKFEEIIDGVSVFGKPRDDLENIEFVLARAKTVGSRNCRFYRKFVDRISQRHEERSPVGDSINEKFPSNFASCRTILYEFNKVRGVPEESAGVLERTVPMGRIIGASTLFLDFGRALERLRVRKAG